MKSQDNCCGSSYNLFMNNAPYPTPYPDVNVVLLELLPAVQSILGSHFIGMYLDGSLATGDFDEASDIDFVVVTDKEISGALFESLQAMHDRIGIMDSPWAIQLEGSYISQQALRRYDPAYALHPNIERGSNERLKMELHDHTWDVHRYVLRESGITLIGPSPQTLIDPVAPDDLRRAMFAALQEWAMQILDEPTQIDGWGYQTYSVLSLCRILYTLQYGTIVSKPCAARWAQETLEKTWEPLIERAWVGRHNPGLKAPADDVTATLDLIRYTLEYSQKFKMPANKR
ncbi:MAG: DUF4111 domain-containing protein [Abitibacteriaceae bacterium]|nr:DUF4111 domain-containing protein [Abditibacteriaceae bacterium]